MHEAERDRLMGSRFIPIKWATVGREFDSPEPVGLESRKGIKKTYSSYRRKRG